MPDDKTQIQQNPNEEYLNNFRSFLDKEKPAFDSLAKSEWWKHQPEEARDALKLEYWHWAQKQPGFKKMDQKAYKDYIFNQSALDEQGYAVKGAVETASGGGADLLGKIMEMAGRAANAIEQHPEYLGPVGAGVALRNKLVSTATGGDISTGDVLDEAGKFWRENADIAKHEGRMQLARLRPDTAAGDIALKTEAGVIQGTMDLWKYMAATSLGGPVGGFSGLGAFEAYDPDKPVREQWKDIVEQGALGALGGAVFKWAEPLKWFSKFATLGGYGYLSAKMEGAPHRDAIASGITMGLLGAGGEKTDKSGVPLLDKTTFKKHGEVGFYEKAKGDILGLKDAPEKIRDSIEDIYGSMRAKINDLKAKMDKGKATPADFEEVQNGVKERLPHDTETLSRFVRAFDEESEKYLFDKHSPAEIANEVDSMNSIENEIRTENMKEAKRIETEKYIEKLPDKLRSTVRDVLEKTGSDYGDIPKVALDKIEALSSKFEGHPDAVLEELGIKPGWSDREAEAIAGKLNVSDIPEAVPKIKTMLKEGIISPDDFKPVDVNNLTPSDKHLMQKALADGSIKDPAVRKAVDKAVRGKRLFKKGDEPGKVASFVDSERYKQEASIIRAINESKGNRGEVPEVPFSMVSEENIPKPVESSEVDGLKRSVSKLIKRKDVDKQSMIAVLTPSDIANGAERSVPVVRAGDLAKADIPKTGKHPVFVELPAGELPVDESGNAIVTPEMIQTGRVILGDGQTAPVDSFIAKYNESKIEAKREYIFRRAVEDIKAGKDVPDKILNKYPILKDIYGDKINLIRQIKAEKAGVDTKAIEVAMKALEISKSIPKKYMKKNAFMLMEIQKDGRTEFASDMKMYENMLDAIHAANEKEGDFEIAVVSPARFDAGTLHSGDIENGEHGDILTLEKQPPYESVGKVRNNGKWNKLAEKKSKDPFYQEQEGDRRGFHAIDADESPVPILTKKIAKPMSKQDVVEFLNNSTPFSIIPGVEQEARGSYGNKTIYLAQSGDIRTLAHEVGHGAKELFNIDLERFRKELDKHNMSSIEEEFAEFSRLWWTNRKMARREFPEFYKRFKSEMFGTDKILTDFYNKVGKIYREYAAQPEVEKFIAQFSFDEAFRNKVKAQMRVRGGLAWFDQYFHMFLLARRHRLEAPQLEYIYKVLHTMAPHNDAALMGIYGIEGMKPMDVHMNEHPEITPYSYFADKYYQWSKKAYYKSGFERGLVTNDEGKTFSAYISALSMLHEGVKLDAKEFESTFGVTRESAEAMVRHVKEKGKSDEYLQDAEKLNNLFRFAVDQLVESGVMSRKDADKILNKGYKNHVILRRVQDKIGSAGVKQDGNIRPDFFKSRYGSSSKIIGPLETYRVLIPKLINTAFENMKMEQVYNFYMSLPDHDAYLKKMERQKLPVPRGKEDVENIVDAITNALSDHKGNIDMDALKRSLKTRGDQSFALFDMETQGDRYLKFYKNGEPVVAQILGNGVEGMNTFEQIKSLRPQDYKHVSAFLVGLENFAKAPGQIIRTAFTRNPIFPIWNMLRDTATRATTTQAAGLGGKTLVKAVKAIATGDPIVHQAIVDTNMFGFSARNNEALDMALARTSEGIKGKAKTAYEGYLENAELVNRVAEYINGIEKYGNNAEGRVKAAWDAMDVTINFRMAGAYGKKLNEYIPFFNAGVQEIYKIARALENPHTRMDFAIKGLLSSALLEATLNYIHKDDDWYNDRPDFIKQTSYTLGKIGGYNVYFPKPFAIGAIFAAIGDLASIPLTEGRLPKAKEIGNIAKNSWSPVVPNMGVPIVSAAWEIANNMNYFMGMPIEPKSMVDKGVPKQYRFTAYTPRFLVALGPLLAKANMSPSQADYIIQKFGGVFGRWAEWVTDSAYGLVPGSHVPKPAPGRNALQVSLARFAAPTWARVGGPQAAIIDKVIKLGRLEKNINSKTFGWKEFEIEKEKNKWLQRRKGKQVFSAAHAARVELFSLLGAKGFFMNENSQPRGEDGKPLKYRIGTQSKFLKDFLSRSDAFTAYQKYLILNALKTGKQLDDNTLRWTILDKLTSHINSRAKYWDKTITQFESIGQ